MSKKKQCFICGKKYKDSILESAGESNFCHMCRKIKSGIVLRALSSLAQQIINVSGYVSELEEKIKELERNNAK